VPFAKVAGFDRYSFRDPMVAWNDIPHGIFVFRGALAPAPPTATIFYPDGSVAYSVISK
jgi:hypothetical protein